MSAKLRNKRRRVKAKPRLVDRKLRRRIRRVVALKSVLAREADGFALIHNTDRTISLASVRSNERMVESIAKLFDVAGYRVGKVRVVELP